MKNYIVKIILFMALTLMVYANTVLAQQPTGDIPFDKEFKTGKLENGLIYYIRKAGKPGDDIEMRLVIKGGYSLEDSGQQHYAHVLEHLAAGSTKSYPDLFNYFKGHGFRLGSDFQATTGFFETNYKLKVPANKSGLMPNLLLWFAEVCSDVAIDSAKIENGRTTVLNEIGREGDKERKEYFLPGSLIEAGNSVQSVRNLDHRSLIRYYNDWYRPDLAAVVVTGDIEPDSIESLIRETFSRLKARSNRPYFQKLSNTVFNEGKWYYQTGYKGFASSITLRRVLPTFKLLSRADYRKLLMIQLFNKMAANRLSGVKHVPGVELIDISYGKKFPGNSSVDVLDYMLTIPANANKTDAQQAIKAWLEFREQIYQLGFTRTELAIAKEQIHSTADKFLPSTSFDLAETAVDHFLGDVTVSNAASMEKLLEQNLASISIADIKKEQLSWLKGKPEDVIIRESDPAFPVFPSKQEFTVLREKLMRTQPSPFVQKKEVYISLITSKEIAALKLENVKFEKQDIPGFDAKVLHLQNGMTIVLKPISGSKGGPGRVLYEGTRPVGANYFNGDDFTLALASAKIVEESGVGVINKLKMHELLLGIKGEMAPYVNTENAGLNGESTTKGIELMLQAIRLYLLHPRVDTSVIVPVMRTIFDQPALKRSVLDSLNGIYLKEFSYRGRWTQSSKIPGKEEVRDIYKKLFSDPSGFRFVFTGNFDPVLMEQLVLKYLGTIGTAYTDGMPALDKKNYIPAGDGFVISKKSSNGTQDISIAIYSKLDTALRARIERTLLGKVLNAAMLDRLRIKMGIAYSPSADQQQIDGDWVRFAVSFDTTFGDVSAGIKAVWEEIDSLKSTELPKDKLDNAIAQIITNFQKQKSDYFWRTYFSDQFTYNRPVNELVEWGKILSTITAADIARAARQYLTVKSIQHFNQQ